MVKWATVRCVHVTVCVHFEMLNFVNGVCFYIIMVNIFSSAFEPQIKRLQAYVQGRAAPVCVCCVSRELIVVACCGVA